MGRPPSNGSPAFRFSQSEVAEMETVLQEHHNQMPAREVLVAFAENFSASAERLGKIEVQMKQVWNWFQNRRYAIRAKAAKAPGKLSVTPMPRNDSTAVRNVPQAPQAPQPVTAPSVHMVRTVSDHSQMEFEAKSARDGAWYDVATFLSHRSLETGEPDVLVRFAGFGSEEDEWISVRKHVRQRSLPCESSECVAVLQGDLILCFQEGKEQALYFDAHVLDAQRRRHDVRGCHCRFLVRYDHDQSEAIDIQLGMAIDSLKATLAVKRRLACEMVKYWHQAQENIMSLPLANRCGEKDKLFIKWKYDEAKASRCSCILFPWSNPGAGKLRKSR